MRKNQISISVERFLDQAKDGQEEAFTVYTEGNNIWETLASGFFKVVTEITKSQELPLSIRAETYHNKAIGIIIAKGFPDDWRVLQNAASDRVVREMVEIIPRGGNLHVLMSEEADKVQSHEKDAKRLSYYDLLKVAAGLSERLSKKSKGE
ncbi:hypothetical protein [Sporolactobacillus sp. KGMB 08714]|uniref:hypothetical protein n=1 Tax=Sporolactobacillus sp. KGMB 08714 TaxID=3064704 RepID=UPI002FBE18AF